MFYGHSLILGFRLFRDINHGHSALRDVFV